MTSMPLMLRNAAVLALAAATLHTAQAAPVVFPTDTTVVQLDGAPLALLRNTVAVDAGGTYHLWAIPNGGDSVLSKIVHATASDGIHFTTQGTLMPQARAPATDYWATPLCGSNPAPTAEPLASYLRVSEVGGQWVLAVWHPNQAGYGNAYYSYNTSVWRLTGGPGNEALAQDGPLPRPPCATPATVPGGNHLGVFGVTSDGTSERVWLRASPAASLPAGAGGNLDGFTLDRSVFPPTTSLRPSADPSTVEADLFVGTPYYEKAASAASGLTRAYVNNAGRTLAQGAVLGTYYNFSDYDSGQPTDRNLWYVESTDGGETWGAPQPVYPGSTGDAVLVDGAPAAGNFRSPEVTRNGRAYFVTQNAEGLNVMVTQAAPPPSPASVQPVPALGALGLLALSGLLGGAALRRRKPD